MATRDHMLSTRISTPELDRLNSVKRKLSERLPVRRPSGWSTPHLLMSAISVMDILAERGAYVTDASGNFVPLEAIAQQAGVILK